MSSPVPLYVVEEHHEAFLVWHYARRQGIIPAAGSTLLHVDEHSDSSLPRLRRSLVASEAPLSEIAAFAYTELDIGNFIWPAVYQALFAEIFWLRVWRGAMGSRRSLFISANTDAETEFTTSDALPSGARKSQRIDLEPLSVSSSFEPAGPVVLDIDLDYFSSLQFPEYEDPRVEITAEAYRRFKNDNYHFLRISPGAKVSATEEDGRYFLVFNDFPAQRSTLSLDAVHQRIADFLAFLKEQRVLPKLICICRSNRSGYTPREQAGMIESELLRGLAQHFEMSIQSIESLTRALA